ncbi:MAG: C1 family peptidase, partial [Methanobrevibacter sp.]
TSAFGGFSTVKLNNYIPVNKGDIFRAVIKGVNVPLSINTRVHNDGYTSFISAEGKIWNASENIVCLKIYTTANSIKSSDLVKYYKNASKFSANVNAANVNVTFNINGVNYTKTSDENGTAYLNINLRPGTYNITTFFNGINKTNTVTVLSAIIGDNLVKYYKNGTEFYAKFVKGNGEALANRNVTFNINGVFYTRETDSNGIAKLNINLRPGNYILTATDPETGLDIGFGITVLPTIIAKNLTKTYLNASQFNARFVKGNGDSLANVNVTFNINGVFYTRQTNNDGLATLNINLIPGKYIITAIEPVTGLDMGYGVTVLK